MLQGTERQDLSGTTAIVTGASRGFGRGIAAALVTNGAQVIGVARTRDDLEQVRNDLGESFTAVSADAADPTTAARLITEHRPHTLVLCAGAAPHMSSLQDHTWETFSRNWNTDVAQAFHWAKEALRQPLAPGASVIAISSGAAVNGSPLSGGYAGANATVKFVTDYAAIESERAGMGITFSSVLPALTPATDLGAAAVAAYGRWQGADPAAFLDSFAGALTPDQVGEAILEIATSSHLRSQAYRLTPGGLSPLP